MSGAFWLACTNGSSALNVMTKDFRRFVGERVGNGVLVLHVLDSEFQTLVEAWHHDFPDMKILRYCKFQRINDSALTGATFFDTAWDNQDDWCIYTESTNPPSVKYLNGFLWMDITNTSFRAAWVAHTAQKVRETGCNGVAIDSHHWDLAAYGNIVNGETLQANWKAGAIAVIDELQAELGSGYLVISNGLWGFNGLNQAHKQGDILASADGGLVEFYGIDGHSKVSALNPLTEFQLYAKNLNDGLTDNGTNKYMIVNGQPTTGVYQDYADDYAAALYCYACFLLGPLDARHGFHYGNFQVTKATAERAGGYDYFDFQDIQLGSPTSTPSDGLLVDNENGIFFPGSAGDFSLLPTAVTAPQHLWLMQEAAGATTAADEIGGLTLSANASPVAGAFSLGFVRTGWQFNETLNQRLSVGSGSGPNPATTSSVWIGVFNLNTPVTVSGVLRVGSQLDARITGGSKLRLNINADTTDSTNDYVATAGDDPDDPSVITPHPVIFGIDHDRTAADVTLRTPTETLTRTRTAVSDTTKGIGGIAPTTSMNGECLWLACWTGATAEALDIEATVAALQVPITGWSRTFENGIALVAPTGGGTQTFALTRYYYTATGTLVSPGNRNVSEGTAEILLHSRPALPPDVVPVFRSKSLSPWRSFTRYFAKPTATESEWLMQTVKLGHYRYSTLHLKVRTTNAASAVLIRCEINTVSNVTHGIIVLKPTGGTFTKTTNDYPYGLSATGSATNVYGTTFTADGTWQTLNISLDTDMAQTVYRVVSVRTSGTIEVGELYLSGRTAM